jgi:hypothetical protein
MAGAATLLTTLFAMSLLGLGSERVAWAETARCPTVIKPYESAGFTGVRGYGQVRVEACVPGWIEAASAARTFAPIDTWQPGRPQNFWIAPCSLPGGSDLPRARIIVRYRANDPVANAEATITLTDDSQPPKITEIAPPSGTKLKPGQRITLKVTASERYEDGGYDWQTGVKSIRVEDLTRHEGLPPWENENPAAQPCKDKTWTKTHEMPFRVPDPAPLVVRLRVTVRDYHNPAPPQNIEYPTEGDWYGAFTSVSFTVGRDLYRTQADIVLNHDGRGNLTGTMTGQQEAVAYSTGNCSFRTVQPNRFRVALAGAYTEGRAFKVFIKEIEETRLKSEMRCSSGGTQYEHTFKMAIWGPEAFLGTPSALGEGEILADGTRRYKFEHEAGGAGTRSTVTLKPTRN